MTDEDDDKVQRFADDFLDRIDDGERNGLKLTRAIYMVIEAVVNDPCLAPSLIRKVAHAAAAKQDRLEELARLLARTALLIQRGEVKSPAAYFGTSAKRMVVKKWKLPWDEPTRRARQ